MPGPAIRLDGIRREFTTSGGTFVAIDDVSLDAAPGEFLAVVGPSGCGKSTLLSLIAGLSFPADGSVRVLGDEVTSIQRQVGFIFQKDALLPWRTALQNIVLPLRFRGVARAEARDRGEAWLRRVGLTKFASSYPHQLSGGMRKRVSIAATMAYEPKILLMDEPFSALDVETRALMENDLLSLWELQRPTVVFITHDLQEAVQLADRVVVLSAGPARVIGEYEVRLPRPRDLAQIRYDEHAVALQRDIWALLSAEVKKAYETGLGG
ncbi:MAG TPA: ABC transporter ATP-binding protein [Pseudonocardiaceae bacterium]|nr:ABC transporter ATP-binding protein [Pseudonocardiaceae bacterium]